METAHGYVVGNPKFPRELRSAFSIYRFHTVNSADWQWEVFFKCTCIEYMQGFSLLLFPDNIVSSPSSHAYTLLKHNNVYQRRVLIVYRSSTIWYRDQSWAFIDFCVCRGPGTNTPNWHWGRSSFTKKSGSRKFPLPQWKCKYDTHLSAAFPLFLEPSWIQGPRDDYKGALVLFRPANHPRVRGQSPFKTWIPKALWDSRFSAFLTPRFSGSQE